MTVRVNEKRIQVIPDSGAAVSIVSDTTAKDLGLKILPVQKRNLSPFGNPLEVLGKTETILKIEDVEMPVSLLVVNLEQKSILLGMDWFDMYDVALDIPTREIMFVIGRQRIKTYVHFEKSELINCITFEESRDQRQLGAERLSAEILCNNVQSKREEAELNSEKNDGEKELDQYLKRNPGLVFTDEKHATRTNLVRCKLWMKNERPFRTRVRPLNPEKRKALQKEIDELLEAGV